MATATAPLGGGRASGVDTAILEAARDIVARDGIGALSMRAVAERVGVSATAIYHYFDGKQALVDRVVQTGFLRFRAYLEEASAEHPRGSFERLAALGEAYVRFALENREYFRVIFGTHNGHPKVLEDMPDISGFDLLRECLCDGMASGALRPHPNPDLVAIYLWSIVHGLVTLELACELDAPPPTDCPRSALPGTAVDIFRAFAPFVGHGLRAPEPARATEVRTEP
jgi:AcrR family transcriptional regulator